MRKVSSGHGERCVCVCVQEERRKKRNGSASLLNQTSLTLVGVPDTGKHRISNFRNWMELEAGGHWLRHRAVSCDLKGSF